MTLHRLILAVLLGALCAPALAHAESDAGVRCTEGSFHPEVSRVPANLTAWRLTGGRSDLAAPLVSLHQRLGSVDEPREINVTGGEGDYVVRLVDPLVEGGSYVLADHRCELITGRTIEHEFTVDPAVSTPTSLGVTTVSELFSVRASPGAALRYFMTIGLELSDGARAASALYESAQVTDGRPRPWAAPPLRDTSARFFALACGEAQPPAMISSRFEHWARLPGDEASLSTEPVAVEYRCGNAVRVDPRTGVPLTPEEIVEMDRIPEAGSSTIDAGSSLDGGLRSDLERAQGCTCRAAGGSGPAPWLGFAGLAFLWVWRRRKGRASRLA